MKPPAKIFIIDDEPRILSSIADLFEDDFDVHTSVDAQEALRYIEANEVAVVLSDERMPNMPGHQFLEQVKQRSRATRLLLTGYADIKAIAQSVNDAQIYAYLTKPCDLQELRSTVLRAVEHYDLLVAVEGERALLHALMESVPDPIYFKDANSKFTRINRAKARLLEVSEPSECVGKLSSDFNPAGQVPAELEDERRVIQTGVVVADRIEELRRDERTVWISTTTAPVHDSRGTIGGLVAISRDITALKTAEQRLRRSEEALRQQNGLLKSILDSMGDAVVVGDKSGGVVLSNPVAKQMFALDDPAPDSDEPKNRGAVEPLRQLTPLAGALRGDSTDGVEVLLKDGPAGTGVWLSVTARPLREETGGLRGGVVVCRDMTLRKEAEDALRLATKTAEHANQAKSEFLSTMSHEIRTPMNAILAMADLLSDTQLNAQQKEYVGVFQRTGGDLLLLVDQVLDLSKVEAGHLELEAIEFDLETLLRQRVDVMRARAQLRGVELACEIKSDVPAKIMGDPNRIGQVLFNLLANALKFTEKGRVSVTVERIPNTGEKALLRFGVTDTGIGIPAHKLALIFAPFTQADASTTRQYGGTGLGLTISRSLVELMGGNIEVTSEVGVGSTFFFTAPFTVSEQHVQTQPDAAVSPAIPFTEALASLGRRGVRVLLADDSDDNIYVIRAYLRYPGIELAIAKNGQEAFDAFKVADYDVVLMDMEMPVMDGHATTRAIRQWETSQGRGVTPVLALTAYALKGELQKTAAAGCTAHLTKPVKRSVLIDAIYEQTLHVKREVRAAEQEGPPLDVESEMDALKPIYLQGVRANIEAIREGMGREDHTVARTLGHQMAGSGGAYGFPEITKLGRALEKAAKADDGAAICAHLAELSDYIRANDVPQPNSV